MIPFSHGLRQTYGLTADDLVNLQYYLAAPIVLYRSDATADSRVSGGKLVTRGDSTVEEIEVDKGTPGIAVDAGDDWIAVSFEQGGNTLPFSSDDERRAEWRGIYSLAGSGWKNGDGIVEYGGQRYSALAGSGYAYLLIDKESLAKVVKHKRSLDGQRLDAMP
jgi:hypothetical protein